MTKTVAEIKGRLRAIKTELDGMESKRSAEHREFTQNEAERIEALLQESDDLVHQRSLKLGEALSSSASTIDLRDPVANPDGKRYSLLRAMRQRMEGQEVTGYEGELSQEIAHRTKKSPTGFYMPFNLPMSSERRDFDATAGAGAIQTTKLGSRFIDALRNKMCLTQLGATLMNDMVGPFDIPKLTGTGTAYWLAEGGAPTASAQTVGQVAFAPTTVGAYTDVTRRLVKQTSMDAEMLVRNDLASVIAVEIDRAGVNGSGSGAEPTGILQNSSITTVAIGTNGGAPTWAKVVELESTIAANNADRGLMGYLTSCTGRGKLKTTEKGSAGYPIYLWDSDNTINGYAAMATNQIPSNLTKGSGTNLTALIFGDFSTVYIASWGGLDVLIDPFTGATSGKLRVSCLADVQIKFRHTEALAKIVDMTR